MEGWDKRRWKGCMQQRWGMGKIVWKMGINGKSIGWEACLMANVWDEMGGGNSVS